MALPTSLIRISVDSNGSQLSDFSGISRLGIANNGNLITFNSNAPELAAEVGESFGVGQGYLKNVATGAVSLVDGGVIQAGGQNIAVNPVLASDGSTTAYATNAALELFVQRIGTSTQIAAGRDAEGNVVESDDVLRAFQSQDLDATGDNLVYTAALEASDDTQVIGSEAYHFDVDAGTVRRLDVNFDGSVNDKSAQNVRISDDGAFATFVSYSPKIVDGDENGLDLTIPDFGEGGLDVDDLLDGGELDDFDFGDLLDGLDGAPNFGTPDVFRTDLATGETILVSRRGDGAQFEAASFRPAISGDGRYVVFENNAETAMTSIWRRDIESGRTELVSARPDGIPAAGRFDEAGVTPGAGDSRGADISADGRYVTFWSDSELLAADDAPEAFDLFIKDMDTGAVARLGHAAPNGANTGISNFGHGPATLSANGDWIVFASGAEDLIAGDDNGRQDVFRVRNPLKTEQGSKGILDDFESSGALPEQEIPGQFELPDAFPTNPADLVNFENGRLILFGREFAFDTGVPLWFEEIEARIDDAIIADPPVTTGYDFRLPNATDGMGFRTVEFPRVGGDGSFELTVYNADGDIVGSRTVAAREAVDLTQFTPTVTHFAVAGIDPAARLDPDDVRAFPTALTFTQSGTVDLQQTPLVQDIDSANVFLSANRGFTLDGSAQVFGRSGGNEALYLSANANNVRTDANLERLDIEFPSDAVDFSVTDKGLTLTRDNETLVTLPSLNGDLELRFDDGDAAVRQVGAQSFEITGGGGGSATVSLDGMAGGFSPGGLVATLPDIASGPAAKIFMNANSGLTLRESARIFGREGGEERLALGPEARGVELDANLERLELDRPIDDLTFRVADGGLEIVENGEITATIPSLNQDVELMLANGTAGLRQAGAQRFDIDFGGQTSRVDPGIDRAGVDLPLAAAGLSTMVSDDLFA